MADIASTMAKAGRPLKAGARLNRPARVLFTQAQYDAVMKYSAERDKDVSDVVREAVDVLLTGKAVDAEVVSIGDADDLDSFRAPFLTKAPAGPFQEAIEHAGDFTLSAQIADELEVRDGDVVVRTMGESMDGAGIADNSLLLMRPLPPGREPFAGVDKVFGDKNTTQPFAEIIIIQTFDKIIVDKGSNRATAFQGRVTILIQRCPAAVTAQVIEGKVDVGLLRTTGCDYSPVGQKPKSKFASQGQ